MASSAKSDLAAQLQIGSEDEGVSDALRETAFGPGGTLKSGHDDDGFAGRFPNSANLESASDAFLCRTAPWFDFPCCYAGISQR